MHNRRHKLPSTFIIVCIIALLGFKDTGIFVKDYVGVKEKEYLNFEKEEQIKILKETKDSYIVKKEENNYEVSKEYLIRTSRSGQKYKVIKNTNIFDQVEKNKIRKLKIGEVVQVLKIESDYGIFETEDGIKGYVELRDLEDIVEESISYGFSKTNKVIKNENAIYNLVKGETVAIKDFKDNEYIIIDDEANEFRVDEDFIEIRKVREKTTRGNTTSRSRSINKVVEAAHNELGKPYVYGDTGIKGYDCSGFTYSVYLNNLNMELPRTSSIQASAGKTVLREELIPGDLIFFDTSGKGISHVGLYVGDGKMIHASSGQKRIMIADIESNYFAERYVTSKRIIE